MKQHKQKLIVMVGVPGSGKSTKGLQIAKDNDFAYVSRDFVRNLLGLGVNKSDQAIVKRVFLGFVEAALINGKTLVADATHLNAGSRAPLVELGKKYQVDIISLAMNTSYETCILRNSQRDENEQVPVNVMRGMAQSITLPKKEEGFKSVYVYNEGEDWKWE